MITLDATHPASETRGGKGSSSLITTPKEAVLLDSGPGLQESRDGTTGWGHRHPEGVDHIRQPGGRKDTGR